MRSKQVKCGAPKLPFTLLQLHQPHAAKQEEPARKKTLSPAARCCHSGTELPGSSVTKLCLHVSHFTLSHLSTRRKRNVCVAPTTRRNGVEKKKKCNLEVQQHGILAALTSRGAKCAICFRINSNETISTNLQKREKRSNNCTDEFQTRR